MAIDEPKEIGEFLEYSWGTEAVPGAHAYLATLEKGQDFQQFMVPWPLHKKAVVNFVLEKVALGLDVYYCPTALFKSPDGSKPRAQKEYALPTGIVLLDFDHNSAPKDWAETAAEAKIPEPTQIVQSSVEGNQHAYWKLTEGEYSIEFVEERTRALTYSLDSDKGGWDINQLARIPHTLNHGYNYKGEYKDWREESGAPVSPVILKKSDETVHPNAFSEVQKAEKEAFSKIQLDMSAIPNAQVALMLGPTTQEIIDQAGMSKEEATASSPDGRSGALQRLTYMLAETGGFSDEQIYGVILGVDAQWQKYYNRTPEARHKEYMNCIARARAKHGYLSLEEMTFSGLLNDAKSNEEPGETKFMYDLEEFLSAEFDFDWIMEGLISRRGIGIITGQPGVGKSQWMLDLTMALAHGMDFLQYKNVMGPVKTLFLSLEMGGPELQFFWKKTSSDPKYGDVQLRKQNVKLIPAGTDMDLSRPEVLLFFKNLLSEVQPDVVLLDSLQMMTSLSLSEEKETRDLMKSLKKLAKEHECGMFIVHHERKRQPGNKNDTGSLSDMYGAQWIAANVDKVISLSDDVEMPGQILMAEWKSRLAKRAHEPMQLERSKYLTFSPPTLAFRSREQVETEDGPKASMGEGIYL